MVASRESSDLPEKPAGLNINVKRSCIMNKLYRGVVGFFKDEEGVTAIEYGLIAALVAVVIITAVTLVGSNLEAVFERIATELGTAIGG